MRAPPELTAFVEREHPRLVRAMHLLLGDHGVAEEVAQEALLRAASRWEHLVTLESPGGWTHRVAINLATSQLRRRRLEWRARSRIARDETVGAADTATALTVRAAMHDLTPAHRRVLVLRHVLDWTTSEIAELDGTTPEAIRQRLHRARQALRDQLGPPFATDATERRLDAGPGVARTDQPAHRRDHAPATSERSVTVEETTDVL